MNTKGLYTSIMLLTTILWVPISTADEVQAGEEGELDQPWGVQDPNVVTETPKVAKALHRTLPHFYLSSNLVYSPDPVLMETGGEGGCGMQLDGQYGFSMSFDYRFWYFFIGSQFSMSTGEDFSVGGFALRAGGFIPIGKRFSFVAAVWAGKVALEENYGSDAPSPVEVIGADNGGFELGTSFGIRVMIARWFGLTTDIALSTAIFEYDDSPVDYYSSDLQLNRFQAMTGIVFAW